MSDTISRQAAIDALIMTCGMILADLKEPAESQLTSGKGQIAR